jgi:hypothetical protein
MTNRARPISEWSEEIGPVLWWCFPIVEAPYVGTPNDLGFSVEAEIVMRTYADRYSDSEPQRDHVRRNVGGWPGYHTHWTPIPMPDHADSSLSPMEGEP